jgi:hypothetical protein
LRHRFWKTLYTCVIPISLEEHANVETLNDYIIQSIVCVIECYV